MYVTKNLNAILQSQKPFRVFVFIPSPIRVSTLLVEAPGTPIGASVFKFELKPTGKDSADPTQHEFQHHIVKARRNPSLNTGLVIS